MGFSKALALLGEARLSRAGRSESAMSEIQRDFEFPAVFGLKIIELVVLNMLLKYTHIYIYMYDRNSNNNDDNDNNEI